MVDEIIKTQLKYTNISEWRSKGIVGEGIKVWDGEPNAGHGAETRKVIEQVSPNATIISYGIGLSTKGDELVGGAVFVDYNGNRLPMDEFLDMENPCLLSQSQSGGNRANEYVEYCKKITKQYDLKIFNSASNDGTGDGDTISTRWPIEVCNVVGALNLMNGKPQRAGYSSVGEDLDFCQFTSWFSGTSFATPFLAGMTAMIYQRYGEMSIEETYQYLKMIADDLGGQGHDTWYGWGQPILPKWEKKYITMTTGSKVYFVNGKAEMMDTQPVNKEGNVFVPIRVISESLGAEVLWEFNHDKTIKISIDGRLILNTDDRLAFIDGKKVYLNFAPYIDENNRTLVPIRFIAEGLNCKVDWVQSEQKVMVLQK